MRVHGISGTSFWLDEILQVEAARGGVQQAWAMTPRDRLPLDYCLNSLFLKLGENELWGRMHAALLNSMWVVAMGVLASVTGGRRAVTPTVVLAMLSPFAIRFAREASFYSLVLFGQTMFLLAMAVAFRAMRSLNSRKRWLAVFLATTIGLWSGITVWVSLPLATCAAFACWFAFGGTARIRRPAASAAVHVLSALAAGALTAIPLIVRQRALPVTAFHAGFDGMSGSRMLQYMDIFSAGHDWYSFQRGSGWLLFLPALIGTTMIFRGRGFAVAFLAASAILPTAAILALLKYRGHWVEARYFLPAYPALLALTGIGSVRIGWWLRRFPMAARMPAGVAALIPVLPWLTVSLSFQWNHPLTRSDWRGAVALVSRHARPGDRLSAIDNLDAACLRYYERRLAVKIPISELPGSPGGIVPSPGTWIVHRDLYAGDPRHAAVAGVPVLRQLDLLTVRALMEPRRSAAIRLERVTPRFPGGRLPARIEPEASEWLGEGWQAAEDWSGVGVRPVGPGTNEVWLDLAEPRPLTLRVRVHAYQAASGPALGLSLAVEGNHVADRSPSGEWSEVEWTVPAKYLRAGLNLVTLRPSRSVTPAEVDPSSTDGRALSFWVDWIEVGAAGR
ncbi:hypothetical protein HZA57_09720 [Candidatus Poribacteria bacterium]|nr:hypothetical protein [Candidatus Poribacteria bacterium]